VACWDRQLGKEPPASPDEIFDGGETDVVVLEIGPEERQTGSRSQGLQVCQPAKEVVSYREHAIKTGYTIRDLGVALALP
jgi:hypothetical protein